MKTTRIIPLNTFATDKATGLEGLLTHLCLRGDGHQTYRFQPRGLNPEDGQPIEALWITEDRMADHAAYIERELPAEVLGTHVHEVATGFNGMAVVLILHTTGCVHVEVQPKGALSKTGSPIKSNDFDIRRLTGAAIETMTPEEQRKDEKKKPSPDPVRLPQY